MKLNTLTIALHTAPTGVATYLKHYLVGRSKRKGKPTSQIAYDEGLAIVRQFLKYAGSRPLDEVQHFTSNHVPNPSWIMLETVSISHEHLKEGARILKEHLCRDEPEGLAKVGGGSWWEVRGRQLTGEWIEMKKDFVKRGSGKKPPEKVLFYVHGGAYFFSSLETHRYQIQRHARKLGARAFAPSYRLAPQYPFPCVLHDILSSYLYLLSIVSSSQIIFSGDSAGAGAIVSLLCILRDSGLPLPAGAVLISPWVDLSHSFPSVNRPDADGDYIPNEGFHFRPGVSWPPGREEESGRGVVEARGEDGETVRVTEQIQMYCPNSLLSHPLVSPINQGSLGGLPPLLVLGGSSELLIDEIVYLAHKAANPSLPEYQPSSAVLKAYPAQALAISKNYPPTRVHLTVYDFGCHVVPTLSITRSAKLMFSQCANFGLWALKVRSKKDERREHKSRTRQSSLDSSRTLDVGGEVADKDVEAVEAENARGDQIHNDLDMDDDDVSISSSISSSESLNLDLVPSHIKNVSGTSPAYHHSMIRERVNFAGQTRDMEPVSEMPGLQLPRDSVGVPKIGPLKKWKAKRDAWDLKYSTELAHWRKIKDDDFALRDDNGSMEGMVKGELPPPGAVAGWWSLKMARAAANSVDAIGKKKEGNMLMEVWAKVSMKPDEDAVAS